MKFSNMLDERMTHRTKNGLFFHLMIKIDPIPEGTGVDRTRRHCSVETIRGAGPSEPG